MTMTILEIEEKIEKMEKELAKLKTEVAECINRVNAEKMLDNSGKPLPPNIQKLLKKKGWTWPPDEKLRKQILKAMDSLCESLHTPSDVLKQVLRESGSFSDFDKEQEKETTFSSRERNNAC